MLCKTSRTQILRKSHSLSINSDLTWVLHINEHLIKPEDCEALQQYVGPMNSSKLNDVLITLDTLPVCAGHPDEHLVKIVLARKGKIITSSGKVAAFVDNFEVSLNGVSYEQTVYTSGCDIISHRVKCLSCAAYRGTLRLRSIYNR